MPIGVDLIAWIDDLNCFVFDAESVQKKKFLRSCADSEFKRCELRFGLLDQT